MLRDKIKKKTRKIKKKNKNITIKIMRTKIRLKE